MAGLQASSDHTRTSFATHGFEQGPQNCVGSADRSRQECSATYSATSRCSALTWPLTLTDAVLGRSALVHRRLDRIQRHQHALLQLVYFSECDAFAKRTSTLIHIRRYPCSVARFNKPGSLIGVQGASIHGGQLGLQNVLPGPLLRSWFASL